MPGNTGRNYVCRMIIRRASRFGSKAGFTQPFLAGVAEAAIDTYAEVYPELGRHRSAILSTLTDEERRFQRTVDTGVSHLTEELDQLKASGETTLPGPSSALTLYTTYGLPLEITRDIAREQGLDVDEAGFHAAMDEHRQASGAGQALGELVEAGVEVYQALLAELQQSGDLIADGVRQDPYSGLEAEAPLLALLAEGQRVQRRRSGRRRPGDPARDALLRRVGRPGRRHGHDRLGARAALGDRRRRRSQTGRRAGGPPGRT